MGKKFQVICADPPYSFQDELKQSEVRRGAAANYSTMSIADIISLPVKDIADPNGAVLALWVPSSLLPQGLQIMEAWGFEQKQVWCWIKTKINPFEKIKKIQDFNNINWDDFLSFGMGRLGRNVHELVLIGTMGKVYQKLKNKSQRTVFFAPNTKHSKKPEILQDRLEVMFPDQNYLEIFGRRLKTEWTVIGNQSPDTLGEDVRVSLKKM
jgi:N6-adenosine-specific RNA methylase IME4